jgi:glucose dehydrogenase
MNKKIQDGFIYSVAVILFVTAAAKIFSAAGTAEVLSYPDPLVHLPNRQVFYMMGGMELIISAFLLMKTEGQRIKLALIAWLATVFLAYRAGLWWQGDPNLCDCLGNLNEKLPISPRTTNCVMLAVLAWLLAGSYLLLIVEPLWSRLASRARPAPSPNDGGVKA